MLIFHSLFHFFIVFSLLIAILTFDDKIARDYLLFDAFGKKAGGNGVLFNWQLISKYTGNTPFLLSGGIDETMAEKIKKIKHPQLIGVDINSGFETEPALKDIAKINSFSNNIKN